MKQRLEQLLERLEPISLEELEERAALLKRVDHKYVVDERVLRSLLERLTAEHEVLEIDGRRMFGYESNYFDTPGLRCFLDHVADRVPRFKARTRYYRDSGECVFEVKLKLADDETDKRQTEHPADQRDDLTPDAERCLSDALADASIELDEPLQRALVTAFDRATVAARDASGRVTIDLDVALSLPRGDERRLLPDLVVVETKSEDGDSPADRVLAELGVEPVSFSKYRVGTGLLTGREHEPASAFFDPTRARPPSPSA
ncbi:MAG: polyphosphate polymerase domain-containing protein [Thermoleophilaceae bacterium]